MMNQIILFFRFLKRHSLKITLVGFLVIIFGLIIFPFSDLNDFISSTILKMTNNQIYVQFDKMHINPLTITVDLENATVETPSIDSLKAGQISASPSLSALLSKKPGGHVVASDFLGGIVDFKLSPDKEKSNLSLTAEKINLKEVTQSFNLSLPLSGAVNLQAKANIDLAFAEQPDGEITAQIQKFELANTTINSPEFGSLNVPEIKLSTVDIKAKIQGGKINIESIKLGSPTDELSGLIKGDLALTLQNVNGQIIPVFGPYTVNIDLLAKPAFKERVGFFLSFIDRFQSVDPNGTRYKFKLSANSTAIPPQMLPLQ